MSYRRLSPRWLPGEKAEYETEKEEIEAIRSAFPKPKKRSSCKRMPRPCPFVTCRYHLFLEVTPAGSIILNFPDQEPWGIKPTCALDEADRGGLTLEAVGKCLNLTRERIRQIEQEGLRALKLRTARIL